jgi:hypothetical protein
MLPSHLFDYSSLYRAATAMEGNQIVQQMFLTTPFEVDFHFLLQKRNNGMNQTRRKENASVCSTPTNTSWQEVSDALEDAKYRFQERFQQTFLNASHKQTMDILGDNKGITSLRFHVSTLQWTEDQLQTAQYALGNMLSSITYMQGTSQVFDNESGQIITKPRSTGLSIVSDRPDHAQGYLWDDGFHQQLIRFWDMKWTMKILSSWYNKTNMDGWIPRQMVIGDEVRWSARYKSRCENFVILTSAFGLMAVLVLLLVPQTVLMATDSWDSKSA